MAVQVVGPSSFPVNGVGGVDSVPAVPLGFVDQDSQGNTYIYLQGAASTVQGSAVTYNVNTFATALTGGASDGFVAFAAAASVAGTFGWYLINGTGVCATAGTVVANTAVYIVNASPGLVDDTVVATDRIENARFASAVSGPGAGTVAVHYPQAIGLG